MTPILPSDPRTFPSKMLQTYRVGTAKVGARVTFYTPIFIGQTSRRKVDVGDHPGIIGKSLVGALFTVRGRPTIFRYRPGYGQERMDYYWPANPQTEAQQAWRAIFADAVSAWQALAASAKKDWRTKATRQSKRGCDMFLKVYLEQHR